MTKILAFAGSTRSDSFNKRLARAAAAHARTAGAEVTFLDLRDYSLPLYDGDLEDRDGIPAAATELKAQLQSHAGWIVACPEYNSSITAVLKNAIDWCSRPTPGEPMANAFQGKIVSIMSASPGALGGMRGLVHVRSILSNLGMVVVPPDVAVPKAHEILTGDTIGDERIDGKIRDAVIGLVAATAKLQP